MLTKHCLYLKVYFFNKKMHPITVEKEISYILLSPIFDFREDTYQFTQKNN